jgi:hypothetical protein
MYKGSIASISLALKIVKGSLRLLKHYPIIILPLMPIFAMVVGVLITLTFTSKFLLAVLAVWSVAFALMFSFAISSQMLFQIHQGNSPSISSAFSAPSTLRMIPRVLLLSSIWYLLVFFLVIIESIIRGLLGRLSENLADAVIGFFFGTIADALRMSGFMLIAIMTFEDVSLEKAFTELKRILRDSPIVALGGLALTKIVSLLIGLVFYVLPSDLAQTLPGILVWLVLLTISGIGWVLTIYLEQLFVAGLYLYNAQPESPLVRIILDDFIDHELPLPTLPEVTQPGQPPAPSIS